MQIFVNKSLMSGSMVNDGVLSTNASLPSTSSDDAIARGALIRTHRISPKLFSGWGPRLMVSAVAVILTVPSAATTVRAETTTSATCAISDRDVSLIDAPVPEWPEFANASDIHGSVTVAFDLSDSGSVANLDVVKSSGYSPLDGEAMRVTRRARFVPAISSCVRQTGRYAFVVDFIR